jgi:hypothetical protein
VDAAVDHVDHRDGQDVRGKARAEIAIQGLSDGGCGRARHRHGRAENGVGSQPGFGRRAIQRDQAIVDRPLSERVAPDERAPDLAVHCCDRALDTLAAEAPRIAIAEFERLLRAGRRARRNRRASARAALQRDVDLNCGIASRVEDLASVDIADDVQSRSPETMKERAIV